MREYLHQGNGKLREIKAASGWRSGLTGSGFGALLTRIAYAGEYEVQVLVHQQLDHQPTFTNGYANRINTCSARPVEKRALHEPPFFISGGRSTEVWLRLYTKVHNLHKGQYIHESPYRGIIIGCLQLV
jgi:hypothetical protein